MEKPRRPAVSVTKIAIAIAVVTTLLAMTASGLIVVTGGRSFEEGMHQFALVVMLLAYLFLIGVLMASKQKPVESLQVVDQEGFLAVSPCGRNSCLVLDQNRIDAVGNGFINRISKHRRAAVRIVVARDVSIPNTFQDSLALFPNTTLLDLQASKVPIEFWYSLEELPNISHVLATSAIPIDQLRNISDSLPEVKFWLGHRRKLLISSKAATIPSA